MTNEQIAHDLAVAKLYGSNMSNDEMIDQYDQYFKEIKSILDEKPVEPVTAKVQNSPF